MKTKLLLLHVLYLILVKTDYFIAADLQETNIKENGVMEFNEEVDIIHRLTHLEYRYTEMVQENLKLREENRKINENFGILRSDISSETKKAEKVIAGLQSQITDLHKENRHLKNSVNDMQKQFTELRDVKEEGDGISHSHISSYGADIRPMAFPFSSDDKVDLNSDMFKYVQDNLFEQNERAYGSQKRNSGSEENRIVRAQNEVNIAFYAVIGNHHIQHAGVNQNIVFDRVITNLGNAYNKYSGDFKAPVPGTYIFSATIMAYDSQVAHYRMMSNGTDVGYLFLHGAGGATSALTVILQLNKGDDVFLQNIDSDKPLHGFAYSTFSGFLLQQDFSTSEILGK